MKILKHGKVVFENGYITEIKDFEIYGTDQELKDYVYTNYICLEPTINDTNEIVKIKRKYYQNFT